MISEKMSDEEKISSEVLKPKETWRIMKNVVVISVAFMIQFTAYCGAANLQSSINAEAGLGTASLAAVNAGLVFSNIFMPVVVIKWIGTKWAMCVSFLTYMPYIAAQLHPRFWTMIPAGLFIGLGGGPLWCSKCTYLSAVSEVHSLVSKIPFEALLIRFFGLFFMIFQTNHVWGNLISSLVLTSGNNTAAVTSVNASLVPVLCGASFRPSADAAEALLPQPEEKIQMITGIYLVCMAVAALITAIGVDSMSRYNIGRTSSGSSMSGFALIAVTAKLMVEPKHLLMITLTVFLGLEQAFFGADFTAAYISCAIGTGSVGFVMMIYGVANSLGCVITGYLAKMTGRIPLLVAATLVHGVIFIIMLSWRPQAGSTIVQYAIAVFWGLCDSVWIVQVTANYGIIFAGREEAAFSNFRLWESVGFIIAYIISPYLMTSQKTYILVATMLVGMACCSIVEYQENRNHKIKAKSEEIIVKGCVNIAFKDIE